MRVFVAGGTGVLGRRIVPALLAQRHHVTVMVRRPERAAPLRAQGVDVVAGDVFDRDVTLRALAAARPDVLLHQLTDLAAGSTEANARIRVEGTRNLVDGAAIAGVRRVVVQSIAWAYAGGDDPADERTPLDTGSTDDVRRRSVDAVMAMEATARELPESIILRNGALYGPGTWYARDGLFGERARAGVLGPSRDVTSFVHVDDAAAAAVLALQWPVGAVNVVDDEPAAGDVWTPAFCAAVGAAAPPAAEDGADAAPRTTWARGASNTYARATLGWTPRWPSWREGFAELA
ncbi:nucleotide-sugar epimerase [Baekduia alba]|uniref:NAD-dependent epimerase/dehydratase family protein n=1 Tax=Baekduia alba TaxID=2997333 RepID=UPI002341870B|nr:NAD-dependent epimerase/dehydratase family protein [Baekduia alba]WCB96501.1 nucleotide-sugar epimerase [Baekduia alba]